MKISLIKNNVVENIIIAESVQQASTMFPAYVCLQTRSEGVGYLYSPGTDSFSAPAQENKIALSRYEFISRFTSSELAAIYTRAATDANTLVFVKKLELSGEVQLNNPEVSQGLDYLIAVGVIQSARKAQILA